MRRCRGFTLIELLVVLAIVALLVAIVAPRYIRHQDRARETVLRTNLAAMRHALDQYRADRGEDPPDLEDLVTRHYLRELPLDPITGKKDSWVVTPDDDNKVRDVHSGAEGTAQDGSAYAGW
jgi:general secretion pathway protein G